MGKYRSPILKSDLVEAVIHFRPGMKTVLTPDLVRELGKNVSWKAIIRETAWKLFTYRHDPKDPKYNLIRRAALHIEKNGHIKWGKPRTKREYEREKPYMS